MNNIHLTIEGSSTFLNILTMLCLKIRHKYYFLNTILGYFYIEIFPNI